MSLNTIPVILALLMYSSSTLWGMVPPPAISAKALVPVGAEVLHDADVRRRTRPAPASSGEALQGISHPLVVKPHMCVTDQMTPKHRSR